jgi:hypothetical protein
MVAKGRGGGGGGAFGGEDNRQAKLTEVQVFEIRTSKAVCTALAARYGVHKTTISRIKARKLWKHI